MSSWPLGIGPAGSFPPEISYGNQLASFHFRTTTVERRHASCLGDGRNRPHAIGAALDRTPLSPFANYAKG